MKELRWAMAAFRVAMGVTFLSPVADRFGLWGPPGAPNVSWGNWDRFVAYSTRLNWYLPDALQQPMAALATGGELLFGVALIAGIYTRLAAYGAASLLTCFALAMATGLGIKSPLDYSVFVDAAGAWLLAAAISYDRRMAVAESQRRSASVAHPNFSESLPAARRLVGVFSPHADGGSCNFSAYLLGRPMRSILSGNEPSDNPVRFRVGVQTT